MNKKIPLEFPLYENLYSNDLPAEQYYVILFDALPSKNSTRKTYSHEIIKYFKERQFVEESRINISRKNLEKSCEILLVNTELQIIIHTEANLLKGDELLTFEILYNIQKGELNKQLNIPEISQFQRSFKKSSIQLVRSDMGHLDTEEYEISIPELNLELNYGNGFTKIHETVVKRLNAENDKGIILLHGEPGTGKTTYLKYLTKQIKDKSILFIPPSMAEMLSEPSIIPFLMENRNSILLIEDAERVIADRSGKGSPVGVSNLLNLTDGILGDCLNIQVIATFNMERERIDPALLRKGRLICEHKFDKLNVIDANNLLAHLKKDFITDKPLTLADIYNVDVEGIKITKESTKIGF